MRNLFGILILGLLIASPIDPVFARHRGICGGYGGPHVNVHAHTGRRHGRGGRNDELVMLMMLSSTSTTIYCISMADD